VDNVLPVVMVGVFHIRLAVNSKRADKVNTDALSEKQKEYYD